MNEPIIVFFDGPCVLCNYWVKNLCVWDKNDCFRFASLESPYAQNFLGLYEQLMSEQPPAQQPPSQEPPQPEQPQQPQP